MNKNALCTTKKTGKVAFLQVNFDNVCGARAWTFVSKLNDKTTEILLMLTFFTFQWYELFLLPSIGTTESTSKLYFRKKLDFHETFI